MLTWAWLAISVAIAIGALLLGLLGDRTTWWIVSVVVLGAGLAAGGLCLALNRALARGRHATSGQVGWAILSCVALLPLAVVLGITVARTGMELILTSEAGFLVAMAGLAVCGSVPVPLMMLLALLLGRTAADLHRALPRQDAPREPSVEAGGDVPNGPRTRPR
ncbi:hypothetical protein [Nocardioides insulae]|uniref:hypothetical protein n=1 Tax=Nocardioides insulae TaxID=394734 RepID=UPI00041C9F8A|nr:hypothetical protein [Nocardioides insulae]